MTIHATANSKVYIGTQAAASDLAGFEGDTYTEIKAVEDLGEFGAEAAEITARLIGQTHVVRRKGSVDLGVMEMICNRDPEDAGQQAFRAAVADTSPTPYNFKVELNDAPSGPSPTPTFFYFKAVALSDRNRLGTSDNLVKSVFRIGIDGNDDVGIIEDPASPGV